jgi:hypothetical protein
MVIFADFTTGKNKKNRCCIPNFRVEAMAVDDI